ncbi:hypothetical protein MRB53_027906 [Persea americana]|uniref:Uncharacterized protein n=1 Tax=Persea americana TaxID=3435 RepID=A0ACC2KE15_PERAE|nr:hypothetical protein MRB53_027906 [Persea americana]
MRGLREAFVSVENKPCEEEQSFHTHLFHCPNPKIPNLSFSSFLGSFNFYHTHLHASQFKVLTIPVSGDGLLESIIT